MNGLTNDFIISIVICTVALLVLKPIVNVFVSRLGIQLGVDDDTLQKFSNDFWSFLMHSIMLSSMMLVCHEKDILIDIIIPWNTGHSKILIITPSPSFYSTELWAFSFQVAFLISDVYCAYIEAHADKLEKTFHHITTIILILTGVSVYFHNSAMVVMLIHKVAEPFLFLGKTAVNLKWDTASKYLFILFILTWIPSRLIFFPTWTYIVYYTPLPWADLTRDISAGFLSLLFCLHLYWTYLIGKVLAVVISKGKITPDLDNGFKNKKD